MTHGTLGGYGRRRRSTAARRLVRFLVFGVLIIGTASHAYRVGVSTAEAKTEKLKSDVARFQEGNLTLRDQVAELTSELRQASQRVAALELRYAEDVPVGEAAILMRQVIQQLDQGTEPRRLGFLIRSAGQSASCEELPESRRFVVETPIANGPRSTVHFAEKRINVWASGLSARTADGSPEAWFDPAEPVHVVFEPLGGPSQTLNGELPLAHRMIVDGREYRFALVAGGRSFIEVTGQGCGLPGGLDASG